MLEDIAGLVLIGALLIVILLGAVLAGWMGAFLALAGVVLVVLNTGS